MLFPVSEPETPPQPTYVPPHPPRPAGQQATWRLLRGVRKNLLQVWPAHVYEGGSFSFAVLGRRIHVVSTPDVVREVFVDKAALVERKTGQQRDALRPLAGDGLIISDGATWRGRRRIVAPVTHVSQLPKLAGAISVGAAALRDRWTAQPSGTEVDVLAEMAQLTAEILVAALFGHRCDPQAVARIVCAFGAYQRLVKPVGLTSLLGQHDLLRRFTGWRQALAARRVRRDLDAMVDAVLDDDATEPSLIRAMAEAGSAEMDRAACRNEAAVMFLAGHETTANTLAWAFFILSQDATSEARLHAEVDAVLGANAAGFDDLPALLFTRAIIQETLRLYPPVPIQGRVAGADMHIGQKAVAAGDIVMLNAWILHRHRDVWEEPDAFKPDRFMPGGSGAPSRYAYVPFGIGPRVCTGAAFGQTEAIICLATLARRFRLRLRPGFAIDPVCRLSLRPGHRLPMRVEARR